MAITLKLKNRKYLNFLNQDINFSNMQTRANKINLTEYLKHDWILKFAHNVNCLCLVETVINNIIDTEIE